MSTIIQPQVKIVRLSKDVIMPKQANPSDAGFDLRSTVRADIPPGGSMLVGTGLKMEIPVNWCGQINPRSGLAAKSKLLVGARIIDSGYRGEVFINLINHGPEVFEVTVGMRVAQIIFVPVLTNIVEVHEDAIADSVRGKGGFGSTGIK